MTIIANHHGRGQLPVMLQAKTMSRGHSRWTAASKSGGGVHSMAGQAKALPQAR